MFDFSYSNSIIKEIEKQAELLIIVDHHITAKGELIGRGDEKERNYHFDMDKSGARLAWEFFYPNKEVPLLIRHIEDKVSILSFFGIIYYYFFIEECGYNF